MRLPTILVFVLSISFLSGCASKLSEKISSPATPPSSGEVWKPTKPEEQKPVTLPTVTVPAEYRIKKAGLSKN